MTRHLAAPRAANPFDQQHQTGAIASDAGEIKLSRLMADKQFLARLSRIHHGAKPERTVHTEAAGTSILDCHFAGGPDLSQVKAVGKHHRATLMLDDI